jgi:phosphatidylcholine synthase
MSRLLAWLVHLYTAMGLVCAALIVVLIVGGGDAAFRYAFLLMMVATAIDATDGWLARKARVKDVLPGFDGAALDNLIDFQTYTTLPLLLIWRADLLPGALAWLLLFPLLASAYGFSQTEAKTDDGFFLGFPSYWNIVAFYLYVLDPQPWA